MKIILFFGAFDPIHNGHIEAAKSAFKHIKANKLIFIPTFKSPVGKEFRESYKNRVKLLKIATKNYKDFSISNIEEKINDKNYTWKSLKELKKKYPNDDLYILMGSDQYNNIESWYKVNLIRKNAKIICIKRGDNLSSYNKNDILINDFDFDSSSSESLKKINPSKIDKKVIKYINENALYWKERLQEWGLSDYRIKHSIDVANLAKSIGKKILPNKTNKLWIAGIYHDIAKDMSENEITEFTKKNIPSRLLNCPSWKVLHSYVGEFIMKKYYCMNDKEILSSIENHTIMEKKTKFNLIIYCADKLTFRPDDDKDRRKIITNIKKIALKDIYKAYHELKKYMNKSK